MGGVRRHGRTARGEPRRRDRARRGLVELARDEVLLVGRRDAPARRGDERRAHDRMSVAARRLGLGLAAAGLALAGLLAGSLLAPDGGGATRGAVGAARRPALAADRVLPPGTSLAANVRGGAALAVYRRPGEARSARRFAIGPGSRVLLVRARR